MAKAKTVVIPAEMIKQAWKKEKQGEEAFATQAIENYRKKEELQEQVNTLAAAAKRTETANLRSELDKILQRHGISAAFEPLIQLATERYADDHSIIELQGQFKCSVDQRIKIWTELLSYQMPKLKAVEMSGQVDNSITVVIRKFGGDTVVERSVPEPKAIEIPIQKVEEPTVQIKKKTF